MKTQTLLDTSFYTKYLYTSDVRLSVKLTRDVLLAVVVTFNAD